MAEQRAKKAERALEILQAKLDALNLEPGSIAGPIAWVRPFLMPFPPISLPLAPSIHCESLLVDREEAFRVEANGLHSSSC